MPDRLAEIRARLDAATPGPWEVWENGTMVCAPDHDAPGAYHDIALAFPSLGDQDLIAHAPADIAWLLALAEALIEQIEFLKDDVSRIAAQRDRYKKRWHGESA